MAEPQQGNYDGGRNRDEGDRGRGYQQRFGNSFRSGNEWDETGQSRNEVGSSGRGYGWGAGYGSSGFSGYSDQGPSGRWQDTQRQNFTGRGPKDYRRSDERIREEVCDRFTDDHHLDASEITIQVQNGAVTLSGTVTDREQKRRAEDLAESISGVKDVTNHVRPCGAIRPSRP